MAKNITQHLVITVGGRAEFADTAMVSIQRYSLLIRISKDRRVLVHNHSLETEFGNGLRLIERIDAQILGHMSERLIYAPDRHRFSFKIIDESLLPESKCENV